MYFAPAVGCVRRLLHQHSTGLETVGRRWRAGRRLPPARVGQRCAFTRGSPARRQRPGRGRCCPQWRVHRHRAERSKAIRVRRSRPRGSGASACSRPGWAQVRRARPAYELANLTRRRRDRHPAFANFAALAGTIFDRARAIRRPRRRGSTAHLSTLLDAAGARRSERIAQCHAAVLDPHGLDASANFAERARPAGAGARTADPALFRLPAQAAAAPPALHAQPGGSACSTRSAQLGRRRSTGIITTRRSSSATSSAFMGHDPARLCRAAAPDPRGRHAPADGRPAGAAAQALDLPGTAASTRYGRAS